MLPMLTARCATASRPCGRMASASSAEHDGRPMAAARPCSSRGPPPSLASLDRLAREFELKDELDGAWAVRPLELVREGGATLLVLEDPGGEPLERLLGA